MKLKEFYEEVKPHLEIIKVIKEGLQKVKYIDGLNIEVLCTKIEINDIERDSREFVANLILEIDERIFDVKVENISDHSRFFIITNYEEIKIHAMRILYELGIAND